MCKVEVGWDCTGSSPSLCEWICGNGGLDLNEECDDGNLSLGDGCEDCIQTLGYECLGSNPQVCSVKCGD